jgi:hypothetical protein
VDGVEEAALEFGRDPGPKGDGGGRGVDSRRGFGAGLDLVDDIVKSVTIICVTVCDL